MFLSKVKCEHCNKMVSVNILQVEALNVGKIGITAQCAECGQIIEVNRAIEQSVYRFLDNCIFGACGGKHNIRALNKDTEKFYKE